MSVVPIHEETVMFGTDIPQEINAYLQQAVASYHQPEKAEALLWKAQQMNPDQLEVYVAVYKFYFYAKRLTEAQDVVMMALEKSAQHGNFDADWNKLNQDSTNWLTDEVPQRLYLYALKALSFIRLRQSNLESAENILAKLEELDPIDQVGASVIRRLADAMQS